MSAASERSERTAEDAVRAIARAVLYEGYLLWPYRPSALKNRERWSFGGVYPEGWSRAHGGDDPCSARTECLLEAGPGASVEVELRFLQVVDRQLARVGPDGLEPADELEVGGRRLLAREEATERELHSSPLPPHALETPRTLPLDVPAGSHEELVGAGPEPTGAILRSWEGLRGAFAVRAERLARGLYRLRAEVSNETPGPVEGREAAMRRTLVSTHLVLRARNARFVSQTDPPPALRDHAEGCENVGLWPVLVGEEGERHTVLASPIILYDHPHIAPESAGDLFDSTEIDQLLLLNVLSLPEEERREMAASDPRARAILERTESLSPDAMRRLHGAIREFRTLREE